MINLKPCPFCGNSNIYLLKEVAKGYDDQYKVVCNANWNGCGASSGYYDSTHEAVDAWNRRVKDE